MLREWKRGRVLSAALIASLSLAATVSVACGGDDDDDPAPTATVASTTAATGSASPTTGANASPVSTGSIPTDIGKDDSANLTGAGASFPDPIYQAWFADYNSEVAGGVQVNYQPVGSGGGVQQFTAGTVDFAASDVGMTDAQLEAAPDAQLLPTVIGAVVLTYNLEGLSEPLQLDGETVANIYLGEITKWNDPAIAALNSGADLPDENIQVVYRSDSSGTSGVFTDYLSKISPEWKTQVGQGTAPKWVVGQGGQGNAGVTSTVQQTPNSIGYVELTFAETNDLPYADMQNRAGKMVTPSIESASAAAAGVTVPEDYRVSITDADGDEAYPIASFTYLILYKSTGECAQQTPLVNMLWWAYNDEAAQDVIEELHYAPLPDNLTPRIQETLKSLECDGGASPSLSVG